MFTNRVKLLRLFGFDVYVDATWLILAVLIVWSLSAGVFPALVRGLPPATYLWMGAVAAIGLFVSIILHELSHAVVARRLNMPVRGITLFIFGGVAEMSDEPTSPLGEFLMAAAGPAASVVLGFVFLVLGGLAKAAGGVAIAATLGYLGVLNWALAAFNLVPAFPLDGGRMFRAVLWGWRRDIVWASRIAAGAGAVFAWVLGGFGLLQILGGAFVSGIWLGVMALFMYGAANHSYRQVMTRKMLQGVTVSSFMTAPPVAAPPEASVRTFVDDYVFKHHRRLFPVARDGQLQGCAGIVEVEQLDPALWDSRTVGDIMRPCGPDGVVGPQTEVMQALARMQKNGIGRVFVEDQGQLKGVLSLKDLTEFLALKLELQNARADPLRPAPGGRGF